MSLDDQLRTLADVVQAVDRDGVTVSDTALPGIGPATATITLTVDLDAVDISTNGSDPMSMYGDEVVSVDGDPDGQADQDVTDGGGLDVADAETPSQEFECDEAECDFTGESQRALSIHQAKAHAEDASQVWCGVCGNGPFQSSGQLAGHHAGSDHDGDTQPVTEPPEADDSHPEGGVVEELEDIGRTVDDLQDALAGAQSLRTFARDLDVDRDDAATLAGRLGVVEQLAAGGSGVGPDEAERIVREVTA